MAQGGLLSDTDLVLLAAEFTQEEDFFKLGANLKFPIPELLKFLKECQDKVYRATLMTLQKWRDQRRVKSNVRSQLYEILRQLGYDKAADMLVADDESDKKSLRRTVEVCAPSESSASITKTFNLDTVSDDVSMVTSVTSSRGTEYSMSIKKDSKFDKSSVRSPDTFSHREPENSVVCSSGSQDGVMVHRSVHGAGEMKYPNEQESPVCTTLSEVLEQLRRLGRQVDDTHTPDPGDRVGDWLNEVNDGIQPRIGAPGADRVSGVSIGLETLILKDYQVELAEPALQGHNTCVVAPTGSGKTYVAVAVAQEVLRKSPGKKVIFVVNQVPLVYQQSTVFKKYIKDVAYICGDHGQPQITRLPLDEVLRNNDVVVLTAQILVDALTKKQVSLKKIGLIVLDECHETKKESQYNAIMAKYMEQKLRNETPLPQILGMTASLGVGNARNHETAIHYMLKMCANMDVVRVSTVKKHKESLEKVVNKPDEEMHVVTGRAKDSFAEEIQDIMYRVFEYINSSAGSSVLKSTVEKLSTLRSSNHSRENFSHVLCKLKKEIAEHSSSGSASGLQLSLMTCAQYLKEYSSGLAIHETVRTKDALDYLQEFIDERSKKAKTTDTEKKLIRIFQEKQQALQAISASPKSPDNPALIELRVLIERDIATCQNQDSGGSFRAILFTQTIASTWALKKWVMDTESLKDLHPEVLVGCRNPGMNLRHQTDVLDNFRNGVHKLLIATSVIQQGIDVPACNFVYRYNYISDAVARIQARGRTRKPGGRFDLVVHDYRGLDGKDKVSKEQEDIMQRATDAISLLPIEQMKLGIAPYQQRRNVEVFNQQMQKPLDENNHSFHCKNCDAFICSSADIRVVPGGHHVVADRRIFERIRIKASSRSGDEELVHWSLVEHAKKEIRCFDEACDTKLGSVLKQRERFLLAFGIDSLRPRSKAKMTKTYSKWGRLPFTFHEVPMINASFGLYEIPGM